jgi:hypothetical protein
MIYAPTVQLQEVARGLWRWTAPHPEWEPPEAEDSPGDWDRDVGCVAYKSAETLAFIDPLVVDGEYSELDELAASKARVAILITIPWHARSTKELIERYDASTSPPEGVDAIGIPGAAETMFWIAEHRALVPGDRILGDRPPGLRICPESWLRYLERYTREDLRKALRERLLDLSTEMVLVSHGEPVLRDGRRELERALA